MFIIYLIYLELIFLIMFIIYLIYLELISGFKFSYVLGLGLSCTTVNVIKEAIYYSFVSAGILSCVMHMGFIVHMVACYRKHIIRLCMGDRSFLPKTLYAPSFAIADGLKYAGYQVAYMLLAWCLFTVLMCAVDLFVTLTIVLPIMKIYDDFFWVPIFLPVLWPILITISIYLVQVLCVRLFFQVEGSRYAIQNRRVFHNIDFFFFFINIYVGIYSFFQRLIQNIGLGVIWISRLDKNMMSRGYEYMDPGYRAYVGFLLLDYHYSNPTVITFTEFLMQDLHAQNMAEKAFLKEYTHILSGRHSVSDVDFVEMDTLVEEKSNLLISNVLKPGHLTSFDLHKTKTQRLAFMRRRNTWCLYITLINNPRLRDDRKESVRRRRGNDRVHQEMTWKLEQSNIRNNTLEDGGRSPSLSLNSNFDYWPAIRDSRIRIQNPAVIIPDPSVTILDHRRGHSRSASWEPSLANLQEDKDLIISAHDPIGNIASNLTFTPGHRRLPSFEPGISNLSFTPGHNRLPSIDQGRGFWESVISPLGSNNSLSSMIEVDVAESRDKCESDAPDLRPWNPLSHVATKSFEGLKKDLRRRRLSSDDEMIS